MLDEENEKYSSLQTTLADEKERHDITKAELDR